MFRRYLEEKHIKWKFKNMKFRHFILSFFTIKKKYSLDTNEYLHQSNNNDIHFLNEYNQFKPFLLIKPFGVKKYTKIIKYLDSAGITDYEIYDINNYFHLFSLMFNNVKKIEMDYWELIHKDNLKDKYNNAIVLIFNEQIDLEYLDKLKKSIRKEIKISFYRIMIDGRYLETSITPLHSPDTKGICHEYNAIMHYLNLRN